MIRIILTAALLVAFAASAGDANANNLKGTWSFVGHDTCTLTGSGVGVGVGTINGVAQGFATFNGDGTGVITVRNDWVLVTTASGTLISSFAPGNIAFTYTVTGDEFTLAETSESGPATNLFGVNAQLTITNPPPVNGTISNNSPPVLLTATGTPTNESWIFDICANCVSNIVTCLRTRTLTKVNAT
jgi:hypothetical protein